MASSISTSTADSSSCGWPGATGREPLDADARSADPRARRATRVASDLIDTAAHVGETRSSIVSGRSGSEVGVTWPAQQHEGKRTWSMSQIPDETKHGTTPAELDAHDRGGDVGPPARAVPLERAVPRRGRDHDVAGGRQNRQRDTKP